MSEAERAEFIYGELLLAATEARSDPKHFFEFVFREEHTRKPITIAAHQAVIFDFVLAHPMCVLKLPPDHTKTFSVAALALHFLGKDPLLRGAVVSATAHQAEKPVGMVKSYIESSDELKLVFPGLMRSRNPSEAWTSTHITVERPWGIRDASLSAYGIDTASLAGSRLNFIFLDDLLNAENTGTAEASQALYEKVLHTVRDRLDARGTPRFIAANTVWSRHDVLNKLEQVGWPTLTMRVDGTLRITNTSWDSDLVRSAGGDPQECRLVAHDRIPGGSRVLWPERFTPEHFEQLRREMPPALYSLIYMCSTRDDETALCKEAYVEACLRAGRELGHYDECDTKPPAWADYPTFTGVDVAVSQKEGSDRFAIFTFCVRPEDKLRIILKVQSGRWGLTEQIARIVGTHRAFGGLFTVENNAAQDYLRQQILREDLSFPVRPHTTTSAKHSMILGVPLIFTEMANGAWAIPNRGGFVQGEALRRWVDGCLEHKIGAHTADELMACYFARDAARVFGVLRQLKKVG